MKNYRRFFLKTIMKLGFLSIMPIKLTAFSPLEECETTPDIQGPFYIPNSPNISILTPPEIDSDFLFITGTVYANDCITPIPNAVVDVWHANKGELITNNDEEFFGNSTYNDTLYRAKIYTDNSGNYAYQTILPGKYLNGSYYRPSHIHYKSSYLDQNEITTQLYFEGDTSIPQDPWASNQESANRIIPLTMDSNNNLNGVFDIYLNINPEEIQSTHIKENKLIESIFPNPINKNTQIYLNKNNTYKSLEICDVNGKTIVEKKDISNNTIQLYELIEPNTPKGIYILKIKNKKGQTEAKRFVI